MPHPAQASLEKLLVDCSVQRTRRSGPGGQHRNKVETAIVVEHLPTGLRGEASERRSQEQNRQVAIFRLRMKLALEVRHVRDDLPSELWRSRVSGSRISVNSHHDDFPALLAEALDVLDAVDFDIADAASWLGVSNSQLIKFFQKEQAALAIVNCRRQARGESPLR